MPTKNQYHPELDGVRAIAALMIIVFHFFLEINPQNSVLAILKKISFFGQSGVSLFFVLSGFLITRILFQQQGKRKFFSNFYIRRSLRIFPLYFGFLAVYYFILPIIDHKNIITFGQQIYFWLYLQNFAMTFEWNTDGPWHFWSLAVEEHFYLVWPFLIYYLSRSNLKITIAIIALLALISRIILHTNGFDVSYLTFARMDELALGSILAILERDGKLQPKYAPIFFKLFAALTMVIGVLWLLSSGHSISWLQINKFIIYSSFYFSLIGVLLTVEKSNLVNRFLRGKYFNFTGKISYGMYVYHPLCFHLVGKILDINQAPLAFFISSLALCYSISTFSFYAFEQHFLKWKDKLAPSSTIPTKS